MHKKETRYHDWSYIVIGTDTCGFLNKDAHSPPIQAVFSERVSCTLPNLYGMCLYISWFAGTISAKRVLQTQSVPTAAHPLRVSETSSSNRVDDTSATSETACGISHRLTVPAEYPHPNPEWCLAAHLGSIRRNSHDHPYFAAAIESCDMQKFTLR